MWPDLDWQDNDLKERTEEAYEAAKAATDPAEAQRKLAEAQLFASCEIIRRLGALERAISTLT